MIRARRRREKEIGDKNEKKTNLGGWCSALRLRSRPDLEGTAKPALSFSVAAIPIAGAATRVVQTKEWQAIAHTRYSFNVRPRHTEIFSRFPLITVERRITRNQNWRPQPLPSHRKQEAVIIRQHRSTGGLDHRYLIRSAVRAKRKGRTT